MNDPISMSDGEVDPISHKPLPPPRNLYGSKPPKFDWGVEIAAWLFVGAVVWVMWHLK